MCFSWVQSKPVEFQPFQRFWTMETAEAVQDGGAPDHTPLKQGVNESSINSLFRSPAGTSKKWDAPQRPAASSFTRAHLTKLIHRLQVQRQPPTALAA
jgi:hypothetical protein